MGFKKYDLRDYFCVGFYSCKVGDYFRINVDGLTESLPLKIPHPPTLPESARYDGFWFILFPRKIKRDSSVISVPISSERLKNVSSLTDILREEGVEITDSRSEEEKMISLTPPFWR